MKADQQYILVIGAAHIDVFANYEGELSSKIDKPGRIEFSLGGTAFNIAANLAFDQERSCLIAAINPHKISGLCVEASLKARKINSHFIVKNENLSEGAYVAFIQDGDLVSAVTQTPIEELNLDEESLINAVSNASVVVADCNLNNFQLTRVISHCSQFRKPILVAGVSESKAERIKFSPGHLEIDVFSLNYKEVIHLFSGHQEIYDYFISHGEDIERIETWSNSAIQEVCSKLRTKYLIITRGKNGHLVLSKTGNRCSFPAVKLVGKFVSSSGAGDALLAGIALYYKIFNTNHGWEPDWSKCNEIIKRYVNHVLCIQQAAPSNAADSDSPLNFIEQILCQEQNDNKPTGYRGYLFSFLAVLAISSIILASRDQLTVPTVTLLSIVILSTLLTYNLLSEESFLKLVLSNKGIGIND